MTSAHYDYIVIGGGITGLTSALELHSHGLSVAVVDAGYSSTSVAGAGILSALMPWQHSEDINALIQRGGQLLDKIIKNITQHCGKEYIKWQQPGILALKTNNVKLPSDCTLVPVRWLSPLSANPDSYGIWTPYIKQINPSRLMAGLYALFKYLNIPIIQSHSQFIVKKNHISALQLPNSQLTANCYILCAGVHSAVLCPKPAPPIIAKRGQLLLYHCYSPSLITILVDCQRGLYLIPQDDDKILVGTSYEDCGFDNRPNATTTATIHQQASELLPALNSSATLLNAWSGLRPCLPDDMPIIDVHPLCRNLYLNTGHGRYGLSMAAAAAKRLFNIINHSDEENPYAFDDNRFKPPA